MEESEKKRLLSAFLAAHRVPPDVCHCENEAGKNNWCSQNSVPSYKRFLDDLDLPSIKELLDKPPKQKTVKAESPEFSDLLMADCVEVIIGACSILHQRYWRSYSLAIMNSNRKIRTTSDTEIKGNVPVIPPATKSAY